MENGDTIAYTGIEELAMALLTLDVPLLKKDFPYFLHIRKGEQRCIWYFEDQNRDGTMRTRDLIQSYHDKDFFKHNPWHPLTIAVHAQQNLLETRKWLEADTPFVAFPLDDEQTLHTKVGSTNYNEAIEAGFKPL